MTPTIWSGSRRTCIRHAALLLAAMLAAGRATASPAEIDPAVEVDRYLGKQMERLRIPGMAVAVVKDGRIVLARNYGIASVEFGLPVRSDTVFAIDSVTKAFTGVDAMRLVAQGRLDLSASVGRYLTDLPETWRNVTIRQLLEPYVRTAGCDARAHGRNRCRCGMGMGPATADPLRAGGTLLLLPDQLHADQRVLNTIEGRALDAPLAEEQLRLVGMARTFYGDAYDVIRTGRPPIAGRCPDRSSTAIVPLRRMRPGG